MALKGPIELNVKKGEVTMFKKIFMLILIGLFFSLATSLYAFEKEGMMPGRVMGMSKFNFQQTVSKIKEAIEGQQMMVVFVADHQAMLGMVGMQTKGMQTLEFFHPRYGKVIFQNDHRAGIEIPLRIVVMEEDMGTMFSYNKPSHIFEKYPKLKALRKELDGVVAKIVSAVAK